MLAINHRNTGLLLLSLALATVAASRTDGSAGALPATPTLASEARAAAIRQKEAALDKLLAILVEWNASLHEREALLMENYVQFCQRTPTSLLADAQASSLKSLHSLLSPTMEALVSGLAPAPAFGFGSAPASPPVTPPASPPVIQPASPPVTQPPAPPKAPVALVPPPPPPAPMSPRSPPPSPRPLPKATSGATSGSPMGMMDEMKQVLALRRLKSGQADEPNAKARASGSQQAEAQQPSDSAPTRSDSIDADDFMKEVRERVKFKRLKTEA